MSKTSDDLLLARRSALQLVTARAARGAARLASLTREHKFNESHVYD